MSIAPAIYPDATFSTEVHEIKRYGLTEVVAREVWLERRTDVLDRCKKQMERTLRGDGYWPYGPPKPLVILTLFRGGGEPLPQSWWQRLLRLRVEHTPRVEWEGRGESADSRAWAYKIGLTQEALDLPPERHPSWPSSSIAAVTIGKYAPLDWRAL